MAIILFNPTDEELKTQYIGEDVIIPPAPDPRHKLRVDDARGRHVLNVLGPRGLVTLEYGDEGAGELKKAEAGRARNADFKRKQVLDFNSLNDAQQQRRLPYIIPSAQIKNYSRQLGIKLYESYSSSDEATKVHAELLGKIDAKDKEVQEKDRTIQDLTESVNSLKGLVEQMLAASGKSLPGGNGGGVNWDEIKHKIKSLSGNNLQIWVGKHWDTIQGYPEDVRGLLAERWQKFYPMVAFPVSEQEAKASAA